MTWFQRLQVVLLAGIAWCAAMLLIFRTMQAFERGRFVFTGPLDVVAFVAQLVIFPLALVTAIVVAS